MSLCWLFWVNFFSHLVSFFNIKNESLILLQKSFLGLCHYLFCSIAFIFSLGFFFRAILYISSILFSFKSFSLFLFFIFTFLISIFYIPYCIFCSINSPCAPSYFIFISLWWFGYPSTYLLIISSFCISNLWRSFFQLFH